MQTICIASNTTWYLHNFRGRLISALVAQGNLVVALSPFDQYVRHIEALGARHIHLKMDSSGTNPAAELVTLVGVYRALRRIKPDLILTYTPKVNIYVAIAATLLQVPVISNISGLGRMADSHGWVERVTRRLYSLALRHPAKVFFQNSEDHSEFVGSGLVNEGKTERLPGSGVDVDRFKPLSDRLRPRQHFVFLLSARMLWAKGVAEFVSAASDVAVLFPNARFWLLGFLDPGNPAAIPAETVRQWNEKGVVEYLGSRDDVREIYESSDCLVLPSYYREGVPRSLLEAASMGLPIITTDMPGCRDAVDDGVTGYLCRPKDVASLTDAMVKMISLPQEARIAMGVAGRQKMIREFNEAAVIDRYMQVINTALAENRQERRAHRAQ